LSTSVPDPSTSDLGPSVEDEITYHGSVGYVGLPTSVPYPSTSDLSPSMSCDVIDSPQIYMDITNPTSS